MGKVKAKDEGAAARATVSVGRADGTMSDPVPLDDFRAAVEGAKRRPGKAMKPDPQFDAAADAAYGVAAGELRAFVERVERVEAEKADLAEDVKAIFAEAKSRGYDTKAMRRVIRLRKADPQKLAEEDAVVEIYKAALGM